MAEPSSLRIPQEFVEPMAALATLEGEAFDALLECLNEPGPRVVDRGLLAAAGAECSGLAVTASRGIIEMAISLTRVAAQVTDNDFAEIAQVVSRSDELPDDVDPHAVAQRLTLLLESDAIGLLRAGIDLLGENDHLLTGVRIISDVRPVFPEDSTESIRAAVVGHRLRLSLSGADPRMIDVAVDAFDLVELKNAIERAIDKEESLSRFVLRNGLPLIRPFVPDPESSEADKTEDGDG